MEIILLLAETISSTLISIGRLALLLIPVVILIEIARYFQIIERITGRLKGTMQLILTLPQEAVLPLMAGMFYGIVLG
ncbi:MAG: hypothetical protein MUP57_00620, partial [Clostridia bacterium]|nr:hypothetical protein [Clostridia bacterium]